MTLLRVILSLAGIIFAGLIIWAIRAGDVSRFFAFLADDPWAIVTMTDLYFGFFLSAIVIAFFERSMKALFWIIPIPFLGNVWIVIWFVWNLPALSRRLKPA